MRGGGNMEIWGTGGEGENIWGPDPDSLFVINAVLTALEFKGRGTVLRIQFCQSYIKLFYSSQFLI